MMTLYHNINLVIRGWTAMPVDLQPFSFMVEKNLYTLSHPASLVLIERADELSLNSAFSHPAQV